MKGGLYKMNKTKPRKNYYKLNAYKRTPEYRLVNTFHKIGYPGALLFGSMAGATETALQLPLKHRGRKITVKERLKRNVKKKS